MQYYKDSASKLTLPVNTLRCPPVKCNDVKVLLLLKGREAGGEKPTSFFSSLTIITARTCLHIQIHSGLSQDENLRLQLSISMSNSSGTEVLAPEQHPQ